MEYVGRFYGKRTVYIDFKVLKSRQQMLRFDPSHKIQKLLRTPYGKGRYYNISAANKRIFDHLCKRYRIIRRRRMQLVAIGRFHNDIIRVFNIFRITYQRTVAGPDIAGKSQLFRLLSFGHPQFNTGRTKQMSGVDKAYCYALIDFYLRIIIACDKML